MNLIKFKQLVANYGPDLSQWMEKGLSEGQVREAEKFLKESPFSTAVLKEYRSVDSILKERIHPVRNSSGADKIITITRKMDLPQYSLLTRITQEVEFLMKAMPAFKFVLVFMLFLSIWVGYVSNSDESIYDQDRYLFSDFLSEDEGIL